MEMTTNLLFMFFAMVGVLVGIFGASWLIVVAIEYLCEMRRLLRECREAVRQLERKESL